MATIVGFQNLTISTVAVSLTVPPRARSFLGKLEGTSSDSIRIRVDGTAPTASVGQRASVSNLIILGGASMGRAQFIRVDTNDLQLQGHFYAEDEQYLGALNRPSLTVIL